MSCKINYMYEEKTTRIIRNIFWRKSLFIFGWTSGVKMNTQIYVWKISHLNLRKKSVFLQFKLQITQTFCIFFVIRHYCCSCLREV